MGDTTQSCYYYVMTQGIPGKPGRSVAGPPGLPGVCLDSSRKTINCTSAGGAPGPRGPPGLPGLPGRPAEHVQPPAVTSAVCI